jgi:putative heme transporter
MSEQHGAAAPRGGGMGDEPAASDPDDARRPDPDEGSAEVGTTPPDGDPGTRIPGLDPGPLRVERARDLRVPAWLDTSVQYTWRGIVLVVGVAFAIYALTRLYLVTLPVILALILSTLFVPPARRLERRGLPRLAAASIVVVGGIGTFAGMIALLTPAFISQAQELGPTVLAATDTVLTWLEEGPIGYDRAQVEEFTRNALDSIEGAAGTIAAQVGSIAVAVIEGITALTLAVVLLFFFVKDGAQIVDWFIRLVPAHHRDDVRAAGARGWVALAGFVRGTAAVALIDAIGIGVGLAVVGVPLVLPLAVLVFFGGFVPVIGAFVTGLLAVLVALADGGLSTALIVAAIVLAVQQVESNVLQPTIMRRAVSLHPVVILGVLTAGAMLVGIVGAFLAVPITAVIAAVGNELRLRDQARRLGVEVGPTPIGGPGVNPEDMLPEFPPDTDLRSVRRNRQRLPAGDPEARAKLRRRRRRADAKLAAPLDATRDEQAEAPTRGARIEAPAAVTDPSHERDRSPVEATPTAAEGEATTAPADAEPTPHGGGEPSASDPPADVRSRRDQLIERRRRDG